MFFRDSCFLIAAFAVVVIVVVVVLIVVVAVAAALAVHNVLPSLATGCGIQCGRSDVGRNPRRFE